MSVVLFRGQHTLANLKKQGANLMDATALQCGRRGIQAWALNLHHELTALEAQARLLLDILLVCRMAAGRQDEHLAGYTDGCVWVGAK